ncbi:BTB/POZ domain-containing protein 1 [Escovopsis weberi]|uniref:BTB/POZ domain-containing protein 1 n=1 Tax=Escovopsis weberi TaxID=150374 RepID=A0A0M9VS79_ESCWE|nr:BTB/POZ domain-containing protein 1 [Escovopsis weberi]
MAHRFRQVRSELMKVATKLSLPKLERAARLQAPLERSQDMDLQRAIKDPSFWEDGDTILELDGGETIAHSQLLCQRCPFFKGMFFGRSQGQWLAVRWDPTQRTDRIRIDLKHIRPEVFTYVQTFLYGDVGAEIFDEVAMPTLDDFSELIIEVLSVANELMIDRLAQICQMLIGKFVNTRNIANLLNEISPCAVSEFKDTGLEYICLQLESMLENHLLDGLDDELLQELDGKVELPEPLVTLSTEAGSTLPEGWKIAKGKTKADAARSPDFGSLSQSQTQPFLQSPRTPIQAFDKAADLPPAKPGSPWASSALSTAKLDLRDMLSEASSKSSLTAALTAQAQDTKDAAAKPQPKMSQKERKRQMQMQLDAQVSLREEQSKAVPWEKVPSGKKQPAWKLAEPIAKTSLQDAMSAEVSQRTVPTAKPKPLVVAESSAQPAQRRTASPDTRFPGQGRTHAPPPGSALAAAAAASSSSSSSARQPSSGLIPHSKQYIQPVTKAENWLGASMADIIGQQRRERELVKEAVAKRSLQEIQQEQAFQEWGKGKA